MPRLLMLTLLACLALSPAIRSAASDEPGVVFHLDSDTSMNRMLAQVARHHAFNPGIETRVILIGNCLLYTSPSPRDSRKSRMPSSA